ncbi:CDP-glycerol glycerophosphotransferase family protein [Actinomadura keratinilytica]
MGRAARHQLVHQGDPRPADRPRREDLHRRTAAGRPRRGRRTPRPRGPRPPPPALGPLPLPRRRHHQPRRRPPRDRVGPLPARRGPRTARRRQLRRQRGTARPARAAHRHRAELAPARPLTLAGSFPAADEDRRELVLVHGTHGEETVLDAHRDGPRFTATLSPEAVHGPGGTLPLAEGNWTMFLRRPGESDPALYTPVHIAPALHTGLPLARHLGGREFLVERRHYDRLQLHSGSSLPAADRGRTQQKALRAAYTTRRARGPLRDAVLYSSFDGRQYSDSPRAIHEELAARDTSLTHLWTVRDQQVDLPPGLTPVALWSAEWYEALARSRHIVTNTQLPEWFERAEGQYVVQTWHGTPLKRIGRDLAGSPAADPHYIAALPHRSAQWSLLVSPNRFSTPILRHAFGYTGPVLESGYPRNDLLDAHGRAERAARVRRRLSIPEDRTVVLYAPTWREDRPKRGGRYALDLPLDPAGAAAALGDSHVLLVRRHYLVGGSVPGGANVRDVSRYPDVAELLLISDVLVTDYSSLMFDFAQTGRPMLFHTWDLDHYRDTLRGFYFDFESSAPGPLLTDAEEVVEALRDPKAATARPPRGVRRLPCPVLRPGRRHRRRPRRRRPAGRHPAHPGQPIRHPHRRVHRGARMTTEPHPADAPDLSVVVPADAAPRP